jgi:phosphate transport system protein
MESRKVIAFGKSSRIISLPGSWLLKNNINKGDTVYLEEKADELVLKAQSTEMKRELTEIKIDVDGKSKDAIRREIISAYIKDFNIMYIGGKAVKEKAKDIRDMIHNLVALEIMEETSDKIMAKDFLNMNDISINSLIRKIDVILRSMLIDSKNNFTENGTENLDGRDGDVDRLAFLLLRVIKCALDDGGLMKKMNMNTADLMDAWIITFNLEKTGDHIKRITNLMKGLKLKKKEQQEITSLYAKIENTYLDTMKAFYNKDNNLAYKIAERRKSLMNEIKKSFEKYEDTAVIVFRENLFNLISSIHTITRKTY